MIAEKLGKGTRADVHTINCIIANDYEYKKMSGRK